jgi:hypothetical protein
VDVENTTQNTQNNMARYSKADIVQGGLTPVPKDNYTVRISEASVKTAQREDAKPTLRTTVEIVYPESVVHSGTTYVIAGRKFFMMANGIDPSEPYGLGVIQAALEKSKFDFTKFNPEGEIDTDQFFKLAGHTMAMVFSSREAFQTRPAQEDETAELKVGGVGHVYIKDTKGNKLSRGWEIINDRNMSPGWSDVVGPGEEVGGF